MIDYSISMQFYNEKNYSEIKFIVPQFIDSVLQVELLLIFPSEKLCLCKMFFLFPFILLNCFQLT